MKWYWRVLISLALLVPMVITFGFLEALLEMPRITDAQAVVLAVKYGSFGVLCLWVSGMFR